MTRTERLGHQSSRSVAAVLFVVAILIPGMATAQQAIEYGARAAHRNADSESTTSFNHRVEAGVTVVDAVQVVNFGTATMAFDVYARDMTHGAEGTSLAAPRDVPPEGAGSWVGVDTPRIEVAARSSALVTFTITAPEGTPAGDYAAAIVVEPSIDTDGTGITQRTRIALPLDVEVLGEVDLAATVGAPAATSTADGIMFAVDVTNTGNATFSATGAVVVESWAGSTAASIDLVPADIFLAPGDTVTMQGTWNDLPLLGRFSATTSIAATVGDRQPQLFSSTTATFWIVPWTLLFLATAGLVVGAIVWHRTKPSRLAWRRRRRAERELVRDHRRLHGGA